MNIFTRLERRIRRVIYRPKVDVKPTRDLVRLGSGYGGWDFLDREYLHGATIVSAGLGFDASFDVEFARKYNAAILIVDPTPKAIQHYNSLIARAGQPATQSYVSGGHQPMAAYPMDWTDGSCLTLAPFALWHEGGTMRFFMPVEKTHVSHSLINFQQGYKVDTDHIEVESIRLSTLLEKQSVQPPRLVKLDIEGAEIEVLETMMQDGILPKQLLIEYDELMIRTAKVMKRVNGSIAMLVANGYVCRHYDGDSNFLFEQP